MNCFPREQAIHAPAIQLVIEDYLMITSMLAAGLILLGTMRRRIGWIGKSRRHFLQ